MPDPSAPARRTPRTLLLTLLLVSLAALALPGAIGGDADPYTGPPVGGDPDFAERLDAAEALVAEGSFGLAHERFEALGELAEDDAQRRWVALRLADTAWRSADAAGGSDRSTLDAARTALEALIAGRERPEQRDRVWVEAHESLGDLHWSDSNRVDWHSAWNHYRQALDWWAGSRSIDTARARYLGIIFAAARPPRGAQSWYVYGSYGNTLPADLLERALRIADSATDRAQLQYLLGMSLRHAGGDPRTQRRTHEAFTAAIEADGRWLDDALWHYGEWCERAGTIVRDERGNAQNRPDLARALEIYRRLTSRFGPGTSRWHDDATRRIAAITGPSVGLAVPHAYAPGEPVELQLSWRNVSRIELTLHRVELTRDVRGDDKGGIDDWLRTLPTTSGARVHGWSHRTGDLGDHLPGSTTLPIDTALEPGAYLLSATAGEQRARELVLVTEMALVLRASPHEALVFAADAVTGAPRPGARVALLVDDRRGRQRTVKRLEGIADEHGLARFELPESGRWRELLALAADGAQQSLARTSAGAVQDDGLPWSIYLFADRPAYRPGDTARWKIVARRRDRDGYRTPAGRALRYAITDPLGAEVARGELTLNEFGGAWGELPFEPTMALGSYTIRFEDPADGRGLGGSSAFRLEEYKLPEFRVDVRPPRDGERARTFRPGDEIEVDVAASYYFGGAVAGAKVVVEIAERPFHLRWQPRDPFAFFGDRTQPSRPTWQQLQVVHRETLVTDEDGVAHVRFTAPYRNDRDSEYVVEARVTDASRREVVGRGSVRAGRQGYWAFLDVEHRLHRPGDRARALLRAQDANGEPVAAGGTLRVTRERWVEVWADPTGREFRGRALERVRRDPVHAAALRMVFRGYESDDVLERRVATADDGEAAIELDLPDEGYYRLRWTGEDDDGLPVECSATLWVADEQTLELGYRQTGVSIVVDRDTLTDARRGVPVMLTVDTPDSWVLFTVEGERLHHARLVHVRGTAKLIDLDIAESWIPNVRLSAVMLRDRQAFADGREITIPPLDRFLSIDVRLDRDEYRPREEGTLSVEVRDADGKPVEAELAVALIDEAVLAIQDELAPDPRRFFHGRRRAHRVTSGTSLSIKPFARPDDPASIDSNELDGRYRGEIAMAKSSVGRSMKREAAPMAAAEMREMERSDFQSDLPVDALADRDAGAQVTGGSGGGDEIVVRSDFRSTALWLPELVTGPDGRASTSVRFPDSMTSWRATARGADRGSRVGLGSATARTHQPIVARLQAPRFFVVGDEAVVAAIIHNDGEHAVRLDVRLDADGPATIGVTGEPARTIDVTGGGETRVQWRIAPGEAGTMRLAVEARGTDDGDAMELRIPVVEHGIEQLLRRAGSTRGNDVAVRLELPAARRPGSAALDVRVSGSAAVSMLDALPYLIDYSYGCTEQTLSRFVPSAVVLNTLDALGLDRGTVASRMFGGVEATPTGATHRNGAREMGRLDEMIRDGMRRLEDHQHGDGGWGWWKEDESDAFMTAYTVWGLAVAQDAGVRIPSGMLDRGASWLEQQLVELEDRDHLRAFALHALAAARPGSPSKLTAAALDAAWDDRSRVRSYGTALLALATHGFEQHDRAATLVRNLADGVSRDRQPDRSVLVDGARGGDPAPTVHWGETGNWSRWFEGGVETTAFALRALLAIDPNNELVEPAVRWLIRNRRGANWSNTRDTAIVVLAMSDWLERSGELTGTLSFDIEVNGRRAGRGRIDRDTLLGAPARFEVDPAMLRDGRNEIRIRRTDGDAPIYWSAELSFFSLEEPLKAAGSEIFVRRDYFERAPYRTLLDGVRFENLSLDDGSTLRSGRRVEVVLTVEAKNDLEYVVFEDRRAAGLESVVLRSGEPLSIRELRADAVDRDPASREDGDYTGRTRRVHQELRDKHVAMFTSKLPEGIWEIRYELRAETPGSFHGLPVTAHAMYIPEIRANGTEHRLTVIDE